MRLLPLSNESPPPLLYLPGGSILDYLLHHISELPISRAALVLQYGGDQIARRLGGRHDLDLLPQNAPFTLLSALASAVSWVEGPTLVLHGNHYFSHNLWHFLREADSEVPNFLVPKESYQRHSAVGAGAYLLPPLAFELAGRRKEGDDPAALFGLLEEAKMQPSLVPLKGWAHAIHTPSDLLAVNHYLLRHWHETMHPREAGSGYDATNLNWIAPDAELDNSVPGFFVTIGPGASVKQSYLYNALVFPNLRVHHVKEQNVVLAGNSASLLHLYSTPSRAASRP
jgi:NDP-sugar pyrophosphorylase family protein